MAVFGLAATMSDAFGATYIVGTATPLPRHAIRVAALADVPWSRLGPGSQVLVSPGTYAGVTTIIAQGTQAAPIVIAPFDATHPPVLSESVDIQSSAWIRFSGFVVQGTTYSGIILRNGSNHVTVSNNTVQDTPMGILITTGSGTGHQILDNTVLNSATDGIGIDVNASASDRTVISGNVISDSGTHGLEIHGSHYQIEHNSVTRSGLTTPGSSGIHIYSASESEDSGDDNIIRYNATYSNFDPTAYDGNGIEVDQFCDNNTVAFNTSWRNDGEGIIVYDGRYNLVENNTLFNNERDPGGTHMWAGGELQIGSSSLKRSAYNVVRNNIAVATHPVTPAFHLDSSSLGNGNVVGPNLFYNTSGGRLVRYGDGNQSQTLAQVNAATGTTGNVVALPAFSDLSDPLAGGMSLTTSPGGTSVYVAGAVDAAGQVAIQGWNFFGAYFTHP